MRLNFPNRAFLKGRVSLGYAQGFEQIRQAHALRARLISLEVGVIAFLTFACQLHQLDAVGYGIGFGVGLFLGVSKAFLDPTVGFSQSSAKTKFHVLSHSNKLLRWHSTGVD